MSAANGNGSCFRDLAVSSTSCINKTTERDCKDSMYCWWQYTNLNNISAGGTCKEPGAAGNWGTNVSSISNEWNPKCYVFDMNSTECNNVIGCNFSNGKCVELGNAYGANITLNGLNCSYMNESRLCNNIPVLSSCCAWYNGSCIANKMDSNCKNQIQQKAEDSCEDAKTSSRCELLASSPWYMPCLWSNSTGKCEFKASDVFGNNSYSLMFIENKLPCGAAGGKWILEDYCEGSISASTGRCEYKFDEEDNCDKACFACEYKDSSGNSINLSNATNVQTACLGSKLGFCEFKADTTAPNGRGYCKAKDQFKKGFVGNCDTDCASCTFKGSTNSTDYTKKPDYICNNRKPDSNGEECKWISDNSTATGGYCIKKSEKSCEDACDRCNSQTDCANKGRKSISNQTGSCKWQGTSSTGSCVANTGEDVEICWNGEDDTSDGLIDCADPGCYADSSCGFVSGDCFKYNSSVKCSVYNSSCEWITDNWGSWCDFKGSQCWKLNQNTTMCSNNANCQWSNGTGSGWCEKDWSKQELCIGKNRTQCSNPCEWTNDTWCDGTGKGTDWCTRSGGGWCDHADFKPKNCWQYSSTGQSSCNNRSGCSWKRDDWSQPRCEVNWSANCWNYTSSASCGGISNCLWRNETYGGYNSAWCSNVADMCWSYNSQSSCDSALNGKCYWAGWMGGGGGTCQSVCYNSSYNTISTCSTDKGCSWKSESGWCEETSMASCSNTTNWNIEANCKSTDGCRWKNPGWCDPKTGGFSSASSATGGGAGAVTGGDCYKYDGNRTLCTNKTLINITCGWTIAATTEQRCEVDWNKDCWKYNSTAVGCNSTNGCWWNPGYYGGNGWCSNIMDQCWSNVSYQTWNNTAWQGNCTSNSLCTNNTWGCEPRCSSLSQTDCANSTYINKCKYNTGWCNSKSMNDAFSEMESGAPSPLGQDTCPETGKQASIDLCGFGMKDMGDSYGFGVGVYDFSNASVCNKEKLSSFVMGLANVHGNASMSAGVGGGTTFGTERTGTGNDTIIFFVYLDTDGSTSGGCSLEHNSSAVGYEFRFKYTSKWNSTLSKAVETFNAYKCDDSNWKATDIKINAWKKIMCSDIGGAMLAVKKGDLTKFPALYDSTKDMRVYTVSIGNTGNVTTPSDEAGPGWTTPGAVDFDVQSAFSYGTDTAKFEDILKKGFIEGEDCFNSIDDDQDGKTDCSDWTCQYSSKCSTTGVNAAGYADTTTPLVTGVKIEEYPDSASIMFDTNKPTNGSLEFYAADMRCLNKTDTFYDTGISSANVRDYNLWHIVSMTNYSGAPLASGVTYYYKLKICDSNNKCAVSRCSNFSTPASISKCPYCSFVTRIKMQSGWNVSYDANRDGVYEHLQGQMCGPNAGMKTNYTSGRNVNIKLSKSDGSVYFEFLNVTLTKTGLNDKVRSIESSGSIISDSVKMGLPAETRDKIVNNLHPEICRIKIPVASGATCDRLYHCDDSGNNCVDRTSVATLINSANCIWNVPYCEFSTYKTSAAPGSSSSSSGSGGAGGGGGATTITLTTEQFNAGYTKELAKNDQIKVNVSGAMHSIKVTGIASTTATITVTSTPQQAVFNIGDEKNFDVTGDGKFDLSVKLNSIANNKTSITVRKYIEVSVPAGTGETVKEQAEKAGEPELSPESKPGILSSKIVLIVIAAIILFIISAIAYKSLRKKKKGY